jgi:predicted CoA-binding protein
VGEIADWISTLPTENRPKILWLQEGVTIDGAVEKKANELGLTVIADRCILKEHARVM